MTWSKYILTTALAGVIAMAGLGVAALPHEASAQTKDTHKVAYIGPLTGPNTSAGIGTRNSLDLAIRRANERGELPFKLELISVTDDSKPSVGVAAAQKMCSDPDVVLVSAHWNSPVAMATGPYFEKCGLLNIVSGAASNRVTKQGWKAVCRVNTPFRYALPNFGETAVKVMGIKRLAIIHSLDDYGTDISDEFGAAFEKAGGTIVYRDGYNIGDRDFTPILTKARAAKPEAILHGGLSTEAALIIRQMRQLGIDAAYLGHPGFQTVDYVKAAGEVGEGTIVVKLIPFAHELPGGKEFIAAYDKANYSEPADAYGPFGYAAGEVMIELLKRYGPNRQALIDGIRKLDNVKTIFGTKSFDDECEMQPKVIGYGILKNGEWVGFDPKSHKKKM